MLELGATGASLRVLWVTLTGTKEHRVEPRSREFVIPQEVILGAGQQVSSQGASSGAGDLAGRLGLRGSELSTPLVPIAL